MSDKLIQTFADVLEVSPSDLNDDSSPDSISQWDSLAAMHLVAAIEETFNIQLTTKEIMKMSSIGLARKTLRDKGVEI
jgi:acyl carrier protein